MKTLNAKLKGILSVYLSIPSTDATQCQKLCNIMNTWCFSQYKLMWVGHRTYPQDFYKLSSFTAVVQTIFLARISTEHIPMLDRELIVFDMISINQQQHNYRSLPAPSLAPGTIRKYFGSRLSFDASFRGGIRANITPDLDVRCIPRKCPWWRTY